MVEGVLYGITRKNKLYVHNWQYICQYSINFKDSCTKTLLMIKAAPWDDINFRF